MSKIRRLPDAELEIMLLLWQAETAVPRNYFDKALKEEKNWADSTILSLLSRLIDKGFIVSTKQGNKNFYTPLVKKEDYYAVENQRFMKKFYHNSLNQFLVSFSQSNPLSEQEICELHELLDSLKKGE